ncbi:hypothetical protein AB6A40_011031 [Gnathostoma spinigerum]|uniref:Uncharacterized protein n=1 Tax=Gnathostoma spinigerum TaxID=75299 RepID=A0ABD6F3U0_9BILA
MDSATQHQGKRLNPTSDSTIFYDRKEKSDRTLYLRIRMNGVASLLSGENEMRRILLKLHQLILSALQPISAIFQEYLESGTTLRISQKGVITLYKYGTRCPKRYRNHEWLTAQ